MIYNTNIDLALIYLSNEKTKKRFYILKDPIGQSTFQVTWFVIRDRKLSSCGWSHVILRPVATVPVLGYVGPGVFRLNGMIMRMIMPKRPHGLK